MIVASIVFLAAQQTLLTRAHSHNDYMQQRPLQEALDNGFSSVEVDVFPVDGKLLVGHNKNDLKPELTIESMYLKPLSKRLKENNGVVYPGQISVFWVLVDVKEKGLEAYQTLKKLLDASPELMPKGRNSRLRFVISGDRAIDVIAADRGRYAGIDGRYGDLASRYSPEVMPWISGDWTQFFPWKGEGPMSGESRVLMNTMVKAIHSQRKLVRFWGAPDIEASWKIQWDAGVDLINTDHLADLRKWELARL